MGKLPPKNLLSSTFASLSPLRRIRDNTMSHDSFSMSDMLLPTCPPSYLSAAYHCAARGEARVRRRGYLIKMILQKKFELKQFHNEDPVCPTDPGGNPKKLISRMEDAKYCGRDWIPTGNWPQV